MLGFSAGCLAVCSGSYPMRGCKCEVLLLCVRSCRAFAGAVAPIAPATAPNFTSPPFLEAGKGSQLSYVRSRGAEWASAVRVCCGMLLRSRVALLAGLVQLRGSAGLRRCGLIPLPYQANRPPLPARLGDAGGALRGWSLLVHTSCGKKRNLPSIFPHHQKDAAAFHGYLPDWCCSWRLCRLFDWQK